MPIPLEKIRCAVYRTFVREGMNRVFGKEKEKTKKFKEYVPSYLPKINGISFDFLCRNHVKITLTIDALKHLRLK